MGSPRSLVLLRLSPIEQLQQKDYDGVKIYMIETIQGLLMNVRIGTRNSKSPTLVGLSSSRLIAHERAIGFGEHDVYSWVCAKGFLEHSKWIIEDTKERERECGTE